MSNLINTEKIKNTGRTKPIKKKNKLARQQLALKKKKRRFQLQKLSNNKATERPQKPAQS